MSKKKANEDQFNELHNLVTTEFLNRVKSGEASTQDLRQLVIGWQRMTLVVLLLKVTHCQN